MQSTSVLDHSPALNSSSLSAETQLIYYYLVVSSISLFPLYIAMSRIFCSAVSKTPMGGGMSVISERPLYIVLVRGHCHIVDSLGVSDPARNRKLCPLQSEERRPKGKKSRESRSTVFKAREQEPSVWGAGLWSKAGIKCVLQSINQSINQSMIGFWRKTIIYQKNNLPELDRINTRQSFTKLPEDQEPNESQSQF